MDKTRIAWIVVIVLVAAVFALIGDGGSPVAAAELATPNCVDTYAGGPDFLFNAKPDSLIIGYSRNCQFVDNGPLFLVNAHEIQSGSPTYTAECPQAETGAPTFLVNPKPTINLSVAGVDGKCNPG